MFHPNENPREDMARKSQSTRYYTFEHDETYRNSEQEHAHCNLAFSDGIVRYLSQTVHEGAIMRRARILVGTYGVDNGRSWVSFTQEFGPIFSLVVQALRLRGYHVELRINGKLAKLPKADSTLGLQVNVLRAPNARISHPDTIRGDYHDKDRAADMRSRARKSVDIAAAMRARI